MDFPLKKVIFHSYVSLPEGTHPFSWAMPQKLLNPRAPLGIPHCFRPFFLLPLLAWQSTDHVCCGHSLNVAGGSKNILLVGGIPTYLPLVGNILFSIWLILMVIIWLMMVNNLVGGWALPLRKMMDWKSVGMMTWPQFLWKVIKARHVPNHQPDIYIYIYIYIYDSHFLNNHMY